MAERIPRELHLEAWRFTTTAELAREIVALVKCTDYSFIIEAGPAQAKELDAHLAIMGLHHGPVSPDRVKVLVIE